MALPNNVPRTHFGRVGASVLPPVPFGLRRQVAGEGDGDSAGCFLMLCAVLRGCCGGGVCGAILAQGSQESNLEELFSFSPIHQAGKVR